MRNSTISQKDIQCFKNNNNNVNNNNQQLEREREWNMKIIKACWVYSKVSIILITQLLFIFVSCISQWAHLDYWKRTKLLDFSFISRFQFSSKFETKKLQIALSSSLHFDFS